MLHEPPFGHFTGAERPDDHTGYEPMDFSVPALAGSLDTPPEPPQLDQTQLDQTQLEQSHPEEPAQLRRRIEDAAHAANALQSALFDLEAELLRLQHIVRRASPAMMQLMQAATEVRAAGLADQR